jgi:hypothetical protein
VNQEWGQAHHRERAPVAVENFGPSLLPDHETLELLDCFHVEASAAEITTNSNQLEVGKVGLPPLLAATQSRRTDHQSRRKCLPDGRFWSKKAGRNLVVPAPFSKVH